MIINYNIFAFPLVLLISAIDLWLLLVAIRSILSWFPSAGRICQALSRFTDPVPQAVGNWLSVKLSRPVRAWPAWLVVALTALVIRHLLIVMILSLP